MLVPTGRPVNARATFMYLLELESPLGGFVEVALVQSVKIPKNVVKYDEISSGGLPYNQQVAVGYECENLTIKKVKPSDLRDDWAWNWFKAIVDPARLRIGKPSEYYKRANIHLLDNDMRPIETYSFIGVSLESFDIGELEAKTKEVMIEEIAFKVVARVA